MSQFTLELITSNDSSYQLQTYIDLGLISHVHKRIETFHFLDDVASSCVGLDYFEGAELDSYYNVSIADRSHGVAANSESKLDSHIGHDAGAYNSYSSSYSTIGITNQMFVDEYNSVRPLFWKHALPDDTAYVKLETVEVGNLVPVGTGYKYDVAANAIYTNYHNFYDQNTGAYKLYFLTSTNKSGTQTRTLLNPTPVVDEATWEDIDPDTGDLYTDRVVYTREQNGSGYTFYFNVTDQWNIRPLHKSFLKCRKPIGRKSDESWYVRVTNGDVSTIENGAARHYWLPEYYQQPFQPSLPYVFSPYDKMLFVDSRTICATRGSLAISPIDGRHLTIYIYDYQMVLLKVWTTDEALIGTRYGSTDAYHEGGKINCYDNSTGLIVLNEAILPAQQFFAQYYYEADDLEYTSLNLNPIQNKTLLNQSVVFYIVPNADSDDRALQHLLVEADGRISYCSQSLGFSYPNLQLTNTDGTYNSDTVVGLKYISDLDEDTFVTKYATGFDNAFAYMLLAEVNIVDRSSIRGTYVYDVRKVGDSLVSQSKETYEKNPKALQSYYGYGADGAQVPKNNVVVIQVPLDLLDTYGGNLAEDKTKELLQKYLVAGTYPIIEWVYPQSEVAIDVSVAAQATITWTWEGPSYTYRLYKKLNTASAWELVYETSSVTRADMSYVDTDLKSSDAVYYEVRLVGDYEYPAPYQNTIKVK